MQDLRQVTRQPVTADTLKMLATTFEEPKVSQVTAAVQTIIS